MAPPGRSIVFELSARSALAEADGMAAGGARAWASLGSLANSAKITCAPGHSSTLSSRA